MRCSSGAPARAKIARRAREAAVASERVVGLHAGGDRQSAAPAPPSGSWRRRCGAEEINRGLTFEYCLIAAGTSHNRAPSDQVWEKGDVLPSIPAAIITATSAIWPHGDPR